MTPEATTGTAVADMKSGSSCRRGRATALVLLTTTLHWPIIALATGSTDRTAYLFEVSYDGRAIGTHHFEIARAPNVKRVLSRADFQVNLLFVTVYRYRHEAEEFWQDGCLERLDSKTDDNGRSFTVAARRDDQALRIDRAGPDSASERLPAQCAGTFAYWDLAQLQRASLLNSQTGTMTPVTLSAEGSERFEDQPALRYRLEPTGLEPITLWYRPDDARWLGLETRRGDAVIRYRPLPSSSTDATAVLSNDTGQVPTAVTAGARAVSPANL